MFCRVAVRSSRVVAPSPAAAAPSMTSRSAFAGSVVPAAPTRRAYASKFYNKIPMAPDDPILGVTIAFNKDTSPNKINLGVGAYRDDNGKPEVLKCVRKAEELIANKKMDHEYLPIVGHVEFNKLARNLLLGEDNVAIKDGRVCLPACVWIAESALGCHRPGPVWHWCFAHRSCLPRSLLQPEAHLHV